MPITEIRDDAHFKELLENNKVVIIDAWADWCKPCKVIAPIFERLSEKPQFNKSGVVFAKLDIDNNEELAKELGIRAMPTFLAFHNGQKVHDVIGADPGKMEDLVIQATSLA